VNEQALPRGEPGDRQRGGDGVVDVGRQRGEVARLDRDVLGQRPVPRPVAEAEHPLADGQPGGAVAEFDDDAGQLMPRDAGSAIVTGAVDPGAGPIQLTAGEPGSVHLDNDVVLGRVWMGLLGEAEPRKPGLAV
jgi:hypothetical protein